MIVVRGRVVAHRPHRVETSLRGARLGDRVTIRARERNVAGIVVAVENARTAISLLDDARCVTVGDVVEREDFGDRATLGTALCGRAIDGLGRPLDGGSPPRGSHVSIARYLTAPPPLDRRPFSRPLWTGVRALDALLTLACGMRLGIFGPPGAGKSSLLQAIARGVSADAVVIALIGERGAEAERLFAMRNERTTIVCASADRSAGERVAAAELAMAQACRMRACGLDVVLVLDSLARYAHALREIALAGGEPPGRAGYPATIFARLAELCECAGPTACGSLTLLATVLSDAADPSDPLAEAVRSHLDGHLVLSRPRADRGAFPAIDVPASLSRPMPAVVTPRHLAAAARLRAVLARLEASREARALGMSAPEPLEEGLEAFLCQDSQPELIARTLDALHQLADRL